MSEKQTQLQVLAAELVTPEREFPPRTPHSYSHLGQAPVATVVELYPDLPETAIIYEFPRQEA